MPRHNGFGARQRVYRSMTNKPTYDPRVLPKTMKFTHCWSMGASIKTTDATAGVEAAFAARNVHMFKANGMGNLVMTTSSGPTDVHEPLYFDQLKAMYAHYVVIGVRAVVDLCPGQFDQTDTAQVQSPFLVGICARNDVTPHNNASAYIELPNTKYGICTGDKPYRLTYDLNPAKFLGRSHPMSDPDLKADGTGNAGDGNGDPTELCYLHLFADLLGDPALDSHDTTAGIVRYNIKLEYTCVWIEQIAATQSIGIGA